MQKLDLHDMWFQQDGATCHTARVAMDLLRDELGEHFISRSEPVSWPPKSCDLTSLGYFLCDHVSTDNPAPIDSLEDNVETFIREILAEIMERVCQNWTKRMDHLKRIAVNICVK